MRSILSLVSFFGLRRGNIGLFLGNIYERGHEGGKFVLKFNSFSIRAIGLVSLDLWWDDFAYSAFSSSVIILEFLDEGLLWLQVNLFCNYIQFKHATRLMAPAQQPFGLPADRASGGMSSPLPFLSYHPYDNMFAYLEVACFSFCSGYLIAGETINAWKIDSW